eukprot:7012367-Prymnesium_polylepis.1
MKEKKQSRTTDGEATGTEKAQEKLCPCRGDGRCKKRESGCQRQAEAAEKKKWGGEGAKKQTTPAKRRTESWRQKV